MLHQSFPVCYGGGKNLSRSLIARIVASLRGFAARAGQEIPVPRMVDKLLKRLRCSRSSISPATVVPIILVDIIHLADFIALLMPVCGLLFVFGPLTKPIQQMACLYLGVDICYPAAVMFHHCRPVGLLHINLLLNCEIENWLLQVSSSSILNLLIFFAFFLISM